MKTGLKLLFGSVILCFVISSRSFAQLLTLNGQLSGWLVSNESEAQLGFRYIPSLSMNVNLSATNSMDLLCSLNGYLVRTRNEQDAVKKLKAYRMWLRFSSSQFELRMGLQKINFGSASILRPLMWFDTIDPRDPLQITDGVYGLLLRYYFLNNINIWLWGLYGNDALRGWEFFPTNRDKPEFGGRIQLPLFTGEIALSFHYRKIDMSQFIVAPMIPIDKNVPEYRYAIDGKWDFVVGFWAEGVIQRQKSDLLPTPWTRYANAGMDYTFGVGNGVNVMAEHFLLQNARKLSAPGDGVQFTALSVNYPVTLLDRLSTLWYYDWENATFYRFASWQRTYDNWSLHVFGFWNPENYSIYQNTSESTPFAGKGFQLMIVYNH